MKKLFIISLSILLVFNSNAQIATTNYRNKIENIFQHIDKSQINTGLLNEYGLDFIKLDGFSGNTLTANNFTSLSDWRLIYGSIYSMQVNQNATLPTLASINTQIEQLNNTPNTISFVGLYYQFNSVKPTASNLFYKSGGQLYDVVGRTQNPYDNNEVFAIAPTVQTLEASAVNFVFTSSNIYSNVANAISQVEIDPYGTGTYQAFTLGVPLSIDYTSANTYNVAIKTTYLDGTIKYAHTKIFVLPNTHTPPSGTAARYPWWSWNNQIDFTATKQYLGLAAQGDVTIKLATGHTKLVKPLIVVNGFDPAARNRNTGVRYMDIIQNMNIDQNDQITALPLNGISGIGLDDAEHYDIVYVHWWNGTDFIQRNAFLLETVIQWVNAQKAANGSTEQNVITGYSMGGLVTRYALRDMEMNGLNHNCRLFISHDAPHNGANIPVAFQLAVQQLATFKIVDFTWTSGFYYTDMFPSIQQSVQLLNSPAARQMLIQKYNLNLSSYGFFQSWGLTQDNTTNTTFMNELNTMGWPVNCKNTVLSNGSCNGNTQTNFPDGGVMVSSTEQGGNSEIHSFTYFGQLWQSIFQPFIAVVTNGTMNSSLSLPVSLFATSTTLNADFNIRAISTSQSNEIYQGDIYIHRDILWGWFGSTDDYLTSCHINANSTMLPLDNAAGGVYDMNQFGFNAATIQNQLPSFFSSLRLATPQTRFCFIPTVSALAFDNPWQYYRQNICSNIPCHLPNAVADWYVPQTNEIHTSYTTNSSNWLLQRQSSAFNCNKVCLESVSVQGSDVFCTGSKTYTLNVPSSTPIVWSIGGSNVVSLPTPLPTNNSITVTKLQNGEFTLAANVSNVCNSNDLYFSKTVAVGSTPTNISIVGMKNPNPNITAPTTWSFSAPAFTAASYMWYLDGTKYLNTGTENFLNLLVPCNTQYNVQCKAMNACGMSNLSNAILTTKGYCKPKRSAGISTFPIDHPIEAPKKLNVSVATTSSELFGHLFYDKESLANEMIQGVNVYTKKGELVMQIGDLNTKTIQLDFTEQADGTYFIEVFGKNDFRELHTFYYSSLNQEEYILDNIANGSIVINGDRATERLYVMQQKLFNDLQCNYDAMNASTTLQEFAKDNATSSFGYIWLIQNALGKDDIAGANNLLERWQTTNTIDNNFKNYYNYYIKTVNTIALNTDELDILHTIAQGCPLTDGEIVYAARDLYNYLQPDNTDDYANACISIGLRMANPNKPEIVSTSKANIIYPNPSKGNITIDNLDYGTKNISITNIYGKSVSQQQTNNKTLSINLKLNAGVYFVNITNAKTGKTETQKLIIQ